MRKLIPLLFLLAFASEAGAQSADLTTPVTRSSVAKIKVDQFHFERQSSSVSIRLVYQDSSNNDIPNPDSLGLQTKFTIPSAVGQPCTSATTLNGLAGAMNSTRSGETGANTRIQQFRILGYLVDHGCITGVTLVP